MAGREQEKREKSLEKDTTNGPDGTVSSKTASSVQMLSDGVKKLNTNIQLVNGDFYMEI